MRLKGEILRVWGPQILFYARGRAAWLPRREVEAFVQEGREFKPRPLAPGLVILSLPAWLARREFPPPRRRGEAG